MPSDLPQFRQGLVVHTSHHDRGPIAKRGDCPRSSAREPALFTDKTLDRVCGSLPQEGLGTLYDLVADLDKIPVENGKDKVSKDAFIRDIQGTSDGQRLVKFTPVRTEAGLMGFDIYGCAEIPYGNQTLKRIAAVRAVREHDNWYFTNWAYADPPEPCAHLSNAAWKPQLPLRLDGPMSQLTCDLYTCEL
jgi:hypothetical protein